MTVRHPFRKRAVLACLAAATSSAIAQNPAATVQVDANANRKPISPLIYGANWAGQSDLDELNLTLNRRGGNATTTYNWQINATNRGGDWYFESFGDDGGATPGASADNFIDAAKAGGAQPMMTIPMVDWVAKVGPNREALTAYSVVKYGAQTKTDPWWPDSGNGIRVSDGLRITDNDPNDAYVPNSPAFQQQWVEHLVNKYGTSTGGGVKYYLTDNEHGVWPYNHAPIMPVGQTMAQIRDRIIAYAGVVKTVDPGAVIVGPEEWGWPNYFNSPYDTQNPGGTDRAANGGWDYMPWLLKEMKAHETATGQRLLDVFSLHYYPQPGEFSQGDSSTAAQLMRNQCTRDLWDPNYTSTSWINNKVKLIPRMRDWVNAIYPGTKLAVTEYNWGAEGHISGAIAQADVLGIFGREGVDIATFWGGVQDDLPVRNAFKLYRNYDGAKSTFGDTSVSTTVANPDNVSAFSAERASDGSLTVMVLNKYLTGDTPITVNLANFPAGSTAQVWQFTSANTIDRLADAAVTNGSISFSAPAQSVTLFVVPDSGVIPSNLKALYAFEGNAQDTSGSGNHGAANALDYVAGRVGTQAAQFNGTSSNVVIPRSITDDFTVAMWVKTTDTAGAANAQWWAGKGLVDGEVGGGGADWGTSIVNGKFVLGVGSTGGDTTLASSVNINDGAWHHVVATRSNTSGAMAVYVDGAPRGSGSGPTGSRTLPASLRIGGLQTGNNFLNGTIDDVRLYDRILSAGEIGVLAERPPEVTRMIYQDGLDPAWQNWSWATENMASAAQVRRGSSAIAVTAGEWAALYLRRSALQDTTGYSAVAFWVHGGSSGGQPLMVIGLRDGQTQPAKSIPAPTAGVWTRVVIPLSELGLANVSDFNGLMIQNASGSPVGTFHVDDVALVGVADADDWASQDWQSWRQIRFSASELADDGVSGPGADPDHDGVPNRIEWWLLRDPFGNDGFPWCSWQLADGVVALTYDRRAGFPNDITLQTSVDLDVWQPAVGTNQVRALDASGLSELVSWSIPTTEPKLFVRLK